MGCCPKSLAYSGLPERDIIANQISTASSRSSAGNSRRVIPAFSSSARAASSSSARRFFSHPPQPLNLNQRHRRPVGVLVVDGIVQSRNQCTHQQGEILGTASHRPDERYLERSPTGAGATAGGEDTGRGFVSEYTAEGRVDPDGAADVRADTEAGMGRDEGTFSATRSAGRSVSRPRIACRAIERVHTLKPGAHLLGHSMHKMDSLAFEFAEPRRHPTELSSHDARPGPQSTTNRGLR